MKRNPTHPKPGRAARQGITRHTYTDLFSFTFPNWRLQMLKQLTQTLTAATLVTALAIPAYSATVIDVGGIDLNNDDSAITDAELGNLDFTGASKLVVTVGVKGSGLSPDNQGGTVTYNGTTMTLAVGSAGTGSSSWGWVGIYYLDDPGSVGVGDIVVQDPGYSLGVSAVVLSGTADGVGNIASSNSSETVNINASANSVIVAGYSDGGTLQTPVSPLVEIGSGLIGSGNHSHAYQEVATATALTPTFTTTSNERPSTVAAEFVNVPEPGSLALLGLGGLLVASRRRRA